MTAASNKARRGDLFLGGPGRRRIGVFGGGRRRCVRRVLRFFRRNVVDAEFEEVKGDKHETWPVRREAAGRQNMPMPIYEYKCNACGRTTTLLVSGSTATPRVLHARRVHPPRSGGSSPGELPQERFRQGCHRMNPAQVSDGFLRDTPATLASTRNALLKKAGVEPNDGSRPSSKRSGQTPPA